MTETAPARPIDEKAMYRVNEVIPILGLSKSKVYMLINSGRLRTVKEGRARLVPKSAIAEYVALLEAEAA